MVGRFVEQEQLRFLHQQTREMGAHHPAAAQRSRGPIEVRFAKGEARQDALGLRFELPAAMLIEEMQRIVMFGGIFRRRFQNALGLDQFRRDRARELENRLVPGGRVFLREESNRRGFLEGNFALIRRGFSQDKSEQRRFPRAVWPDQAHAIATIYLERRLFKEDATGERLGDLGNREHASGGESRESAAQRNPSTASIPVRRSLGEGGSPYFRSSSHAFERRAVGTAGIARPPAA